MLFQKKSVHSHLLVKFQKHRKRWQKHLTTSRNENAVQLRKHSVEIVEKHHAHGVDKRRQTSPQKRSHQKLIQFAVQIASSANEFHRKRSSFPKS